MKFLCDQCKAKYQIADEKVQGKTLRMKCRKCGHVIEIRAEGATSVPPSASATGETMQVSGLSEEAAADALRGKRPAPQPPTAPPKAAAPPRPMTAPGKPMTAPGKSLAPAAKPAIAAPRPTSSPRPATAAPAGGALASAFSKSVQHTKPADMPASSAPTDPPADEWYVAIDEVPVGPIRLTELRAKYAQGAVTDDSLVWREGFEEWRPLRTLPDLHGLVREEVVTSAPRNSFLPPAPNAPTRTSPRPAASPAKPTGGTGRAGMVSTPAPTRSGGNVIPFVQPRGGAAAARKLDEDFDDEATQIAASPVIPPSPSPAVGGAAAAGAKTVDDPFASPASGPSPILAAAAPAAAPIAPIAPTSFDAERHTMLDRITERTGISKGIAALIAAACLLVGVIIAVLAVKPKVVERVIEKRVEVPVSVQVPTAAEPTQTAVAAASAEPSASSAKVAWKGGSASGAPKPATSQGGSKALSGLDLGPEGPPVPGAGGGGGGAGAPLDGKAVENVVTSKRVGVRKSCYEPWADKGNASVTIQIHVTPAGSVDSADITSTSGEPSVGQCVQKQARGWRFPPSEGGGTFKIPFLFST